jgi:hypothetical protein
MQVKGEVERRVDGDSFAVVLFLLRMRGVGDMRLGGVCRTTDCTAEIRVIRQRYGLYGRGILRETL